MNFKKLTWAVALTTVPERREVLLPRTLASLEAAGWPPAEVRLCVDGERDPRAYGMLGCPLTLHYPRFHGNPEGTNRGNVCANWCLALLELWWRHPAAHRYLIVQDDVLFVRGLRDYLDAASYPPQGYLNLYTDYWSEQVTRGQPRPTWVRGNILKQIDGQPNDRPVGKHVGFQMGRGALALVFDRTAVIALLTRPCFTMKAQDPVNGWRRVDGMIVTAMNEAGLSEWVHCPSLVQHQGNGQDNNSRSTISNLPTPPATTFPGVTFDAREWLRAREATKEATTKETTNA